MVSRDTPASLARWLAVRRAAIFDGSCHKYYFCRDKVLSRGDKTSLLSRQMFCRDKIMSVATKYLCRDKTFVTTNICRDKHVFVATKVLSRQTRVCHDKTRLLSRQNYASIIFVPTNTPKKCFVVTKALSRQKNDTCGSFRQR